MFSVRTNKLVSLAQKGDPYARKILMDSNKNFIQKIASRICNEALRWNINKELEIALNAFDEAIDSFLKTKEEHFLNYARKMICLRLADYYKEESKPEIFAKHLTVGNFFHSYMPQNTDRRKKIEELWEKHKDFLEEHGVSRKDLLGKQKKEEYCLVIQLKHKINSARGRLKKYWEYLKEEIS